jgi:molybdopterin-guanine dinucleotide biosynthesis protein A
MTKRAALVLAGGKSSRFQSLQQKWQDKAMALFENKPFLVHVIEKVSCVVDEVIVCVNDESRKEQYLEILEKKYNLRIKIVVDKKTKVDGPNKAILTGLKTAQSEQCLIIPCDVPFVKTNVIDHLFNVSKKFDVTMPIWPNGYLEQLFMVLKRSIGQEILQILCQLECSHVTDIPRASTKTLLVSTVKNIKPLDPQLRSFTNINYPETIEKQQSYNIQGPIQKNIHLHQENMSTANLQLMCEAIKMSENNDFKGAQEKFEICKEHFEACDNFFWAALCCEGKGETVLKQAQQQKNVNNQAYLEFDFKSKEAFFDAANNYEKEAEIYKKRQCTQLVDRAIADKNRCKNMAL